MQPELERQLANERSERLRRAGARARRAVERSAEAPGVEVMIRGARRADASALVALAALDGTLPPIGPALVAEVHGTIHAALPLDGGRAFSDPFRHTADLIALLEARAAQLERERVARSPRASRFAWLTPAALRRLV